jgi:hypothetical protein
MATADAAKGHVRNPETAKRVKAAEKDQAADREFMNVHHRFVAPTHALPKSGISRAISRSVA